MAPRERDAERRRPPLGARWNPCSAAASAAITVAVAVPPAVPVAVPALLGHVALGRRQQRRGVDRRRLFGWSELGWSLFGWSACKRRRQ